MAAGRADMSLQRVAAMCEMEDCDQRADYFWHWRVRPTVSWIPVCATHIHDIAESMETYDFIVAPAAEMAGETYRGSDLLPDERAERNDPVTGRLVRVW